MSPISGYLTPEARATLDAVFAKLAAPGMCNPADETPCVSGTPSQAAIQGDTRSLGASATTTPCSPPPAPCWPPVSSVSTTAYRPRIIVTTTLQELEAGAGQGAHRRRHPAADDRCDPAGRPRPPLPGHLRQRQSAGALSHQTPGLTGPANCVVRQGSWLLIPRLHRARATSARSTTATPTPPTPSPTSTTSPSACGPNHKLADQGWTTRKNQPRRHRMDPPTTPRPRPTPRQHLPPPRETATRRRRRRAGVSGRRFDQPA